MVPRAVQVWLRRSAGRTTHLAAGRLDGRQRPHPALEGRFPPRSQHPTQLLALVQRQPPGRSPGVSRPSGRKQGQLPALYPTVFWCKGTGCTRRHNAGWHRNGRLGAVLTVAHGVVLACASLLLAVEIQHRSCFSSGQRAYPWVKEVCTFIENITTLNAEGQRKLPHSTSPEIRDNKLEAWFPKNTNYDLALMRFALKGRGRNGYCPGPYRRSGAMAKAERRIRRVCADGKQRIEVCALAALQ